MPNAAIPTAQLDIDPEDADEIEDLPRVLDLGEIAVEELSLALPTYPRAANVPEGDLSARPKGSDPIDDDVVRPFAGLAALRDKMNRDEE